MILSKEFNWDVSPETIISEELSLNYNIENLVKKKAINEKNAYRENIEDGIFAIGTRIRELRMKMGWTLMEVSKKTQIQFPYNKSYWISHSHIADIEKGNQINFHVHKMKALASVYGVSLEYILNGKHRPTSTTVDRENNLLIIPLASDVLKNDDEFINKLATMFVKTFETV